MTIDEFADGIRILATYVSGYALGSEHDVVYVYGVPSIPDTTILEKLGWNKHPQEDNLTTWSAYL